MVTTLSQGHEHRERERRHPGVTSIVDDQVLPLDPRAQALEAYILEAYILEAYILEACILQAALLRAGAFVSGAGAGRERSDIGIEGDVCGTVARLPQWCVCGTDRGNLRAARQASGAWRTTCLRMATCAAT